MSDEYAPPPRSGDGSAPAATILVIDDHASNLQVLTTFLADQHFRILVARDGQSGLEKAAYARPDLILLDVNLPDLDGFTICRTLKQTPALQHIPVIFITGHANNLDQKIQGFAVGAVDYLSKPIQQEELLARVSVHLRLKALTERLQQQTAVLQAEVQERSRAEAALQQYQVELEARVAARTSDLAEANQKLQEAYERLGHLHMDLTRSRDLLQTLFDGLDSGLALLDAQDRVLVANQSMRRLLHHTDSLDGAMLVESAPFTAELIALARQQGAGQRMRRTVVEAKRPSRTLALAALPLPHPEGRVDHVLIHIADESERAHLEAVAIQNERFAASGRLAASVAHEVNSPLQAIQNFLFIVGTAPDTERRRFLNLISEEIQRIGQILRRLMNFQQTGDERRQPFDCHEVIERVLLLASGRLAKQRVQVRRSFAAALPLLEGRPDYLTQIMLNLVLNAADAMGEGGILEISTTADASQIGITLADTGVGIPEELIDRIFEPFFTTRAEGTGVGLAVTRRLVEELHGTIQVASTAGQGSTFQITFPINAGLPAS